MPKKENPLDKRPVNLNLLSLKLPVTAIVSILHRISGFALFLAIPLILWTMQYSLSNNSNFNTLKNNLNIFYFKFLFWIVLVGLFYHLIAGVRHLLMDMHIGDTKQGGRYGAYGIFFLTVITSVMLGLYLW